MHADSFLQAAALVNTQDDNRIKLLYEFLADACEVYSEVFPLMWVQSSTISLMVAINDKILLE